MKFIVTSMRDVLVGFGSPAIHVNDAAAKREFLSAVKGAAPDTVSGARPGDFELYKIGDFDSKLGKITPIDPPVFLARGDQIEW